MEQHPLLDALQVTVPEIRGCSDRAPVQQVVPQFLRLLASGGPRRASGSAKAGVIRDLLAILEAVDCRWLFGGCQPNASPALLCDLVVALNRCTAPPQQEPDRGGDGPSYAEVADQSVDVGLVFCNIMEKLEVAKSLVGLGSGVVGSALRQVAGPVFIFATTHLAEMPWSNLKMRSVTQELLAGLLRATDCQSVPEFLRGAHEGEDGWFAVVMHCLKPELTKDTWEHNPATKHVFSTVLQQVTRPWLDHHLEKVLPPSLLLSDDYRAENKILGVRCLHHIIRNVVRKRCQPKKVKGSRHTRSELIIHWVRYGLFHQGKKHMLNPHKLPQRWTHARRVFQKWPAPSPPLLRCTFQGWRAKMTSEFFYSSKNWGLAS
uniref:TELO2 interacting protein 2 n=1 Tax=Varanus komodoensis TaxID=61221 RepID=A0A8D2Q6I7_VARKO